MEKQTYRTSIFEKWSWDIKQVTNNGLSYSIETGSKDIRIGIIDSGLDIKHPDLTNNICSSSKSFIDESPFTDLSGHGTMIAGQIAAKGNIFGIGPNLGLVSYKVMDKNNKGDSTTIVSAIYQAIIDKVDIINLSLGTYKSVSQDKYIFEEYKKVLGYAKENGVIVVASAGTHGINVKRRINNEVIYHLPGGIPGVLSVLGLDKKGRYVSYSNYGKGVNFGMPSGDYGDRWKKDGTINIKNMCLVNYPTTIEQSPLSRAVGFPGGYEFMIGTSLASAKLSGVIGVLQSYSLKITGKKLERNSLYQILNNSSKKTKKSEFSFKNINLYKSLLLLNNKL